MNIAERIERGLALECYSCFGTQDFCEKCPIAVHCKAAKNDDLHLRTYENWKYDNIADQHTEIKQEVLPNRITVSSDADKAVATVFTAVFTLTEKQFAVLRARFRNPCENSVKLAKRLKLGSTQALFAHYQKIIKKVPQLSEFLFFRQVGKERKHVGGRGRPTPVICVETGEFFKSTTEAANMKKTHHTSIRRACEVGYRAGGYHWRFVSPPAKTQAKQAIMEVKDNENDA